MNIYRFRVSLVHPYIPPLGIVPWIECTLHYDVGPIALNSQKHLMVRQRQMSWRRRKRGWGAAAMMNTKAGQSFGNQGKRTFPLERMVRCITCSWKVELNKDWEVSFWFSNEEVTEDHSETHFGGVEGAEATAWSELRSRWEVRRGRQCVYATLEQFCWRGKWRSEKGPGGKK